jgi:hypothetical protein
LSLPIPRDFPDLLKSALVNILTLVSAEQAVGFTFNVLRDRLSPPPKGHFPLVNIWTPEDNPDANDPMSEARTVTVNLDLYARGEEEIDSDPRGADEVAVGRLDYLRAQVIDGIFRPENRQNGLAFGFPQNTIGRLHRARWQMFQTDLKMPAEDLVGGRLSVDFEYEWSPSDVAPGPALDQVYVTDTTKSLWTGLYSPGGNT